MGLRERIADGLAPETFYIAPPKSRDKKHDPIPRISVPESLAYFFKTGRFPRHVEFVFLSSGGSVKAFVVAGLMKLLHEYDMVPDKYVLSSASTFAGIYEIVDHDIKLLEDFILQIPDLLVKKKAPRAMRSIEWVAKNTIERFTGLHVSERISELAMLYVLTRQGELVQLEEGTLMTNAGAVDTSPLETKLKELCKNSDGGDKLSGQYPKIFMMATDLEKGLVALSRDHPQIPLYRAFSSAITLPKYFGPAVHQLNGSQTAIVLVDAGELCYLPLRRTLVGNKGTILAVDLGYRALDYRSYHSNGKPFDISGVAGIEKLRELLADLKAKDNTRHLVEDMTGVPIDTAEKSGDKNNYRLYFNAPSFRDIPPGTLWISMEERRALVDRGYKIGQELMKRFRRPLYTFG